MQYNTLLGGAYQIKKILVFSAYNISGIGKKLDTEQPVMLRLWLTARAASAKEQAHIHAEVAALQHVQHPHLLPILDVRASEQGVLLVSEPAQSGSLNGRLQQPLPFEDALHIIRQTGQALYALHQQGITHANLMPYSVFFTEPGYVRLGEPRVNSILASIQNYQSALEECVPLCWYMAPEQFQEVRNAQSDQYALGCLAYRLFTGQVPFEGTARATLLQRHQRDQPTSLLELKPALSPHIETAVLKALAKQPSDRHKSVQAFLDALEETPYPTAIGKKEELVRSFAPMLAGLEALPQSTPVSTFKVPGSALMDKETFPLLGPVTAATWTRTHVNAASPVPFVQSANSRQPPGKFFQRRKLFVLIAVMLLVFASVFAVGRGLFFSGGQTRGQPVSAQIVVTTTVIPPASPQAWGTAIVGQSLSPSASPEPTAAPSSTRAAGATPTPKGAAGATPTPKGAASPTPTPQSAASATPTPTPTPDTSPACVGNGVYVYQDSNYTGICEKFIVSVPQLRGTIVGSDTASSIKIVGNYSVTLYANANYQGASSVVTSNVPYLGALAVGNDTLSSLAVQRT